jgi:hypothetical protein
MEASLRFSRYTTNGVTLHCAEAGPEDGRLVILLHGFPEFWYGWRYQIDALAVRANGSLLPISGAIIKAQNPKELRPIASIFWRPMSSDSPIRSDAPTLPSPGMIGAGLSAGGLFRVIRTVSNVSWL